MIEDMTNYLGRLAAHLRECNRRYPKAWRQVDMMRARRRDLDDWPGWCFCPMAASHAIVCQQHGVADVMLDDRALDIFRVASLSAWRVSQGIYLIDPTVRSSVMGTPIDGTIPVDILMQLPEWCCYVPTPGHEVDGKELVGFFAHLEHDVNDRRTELRIEMDFAADAPFDALSPEILHLIPGMDFNEGYRAMLAEMRRVIEVRTGRVVSGNYADAEQKVLATAYQRAAPLISLLLYLCSQTAEYRRGGEHTPSRPSNPGERKTKDGWRLFAPDRPRVWYVGEQIGRTIRDGMAMVRDYDVERKGPRPHVRRAHWHSFWKGPRGDEARRKAVLKWLPPIPVAMEEDTPEARMRRGKLEPIRDLNAATMAASAELEGRNE